MAQPPQTPKCLQIGATRSWLGLSTLQEMPPVGMAGDGFDRHRLARQRIGHKHRAHIGIGDAVAAMAEARDGELLSHAPRPEQEFGIAVATGDRRWRDAETRQPSAATKATMSAQTAACTDVSRTMPFLTCAGPASNCGLISAMSCGAMRGELERRRQRELERNEADVDGDQVRGLAQLRRSDVADVGLLERHDLGARAQSSRATARGRHRRHRRAGRRARAAPA